MIRQITLIKFKEGVDQLSYDTMESGLSSLIAVVPGLLRFEYGPDLNLEDDTFDYALVIDFESEQVWHSYRSHPDHIAFAEQAMELIKDVKRVQYQPNRI